MKEVTKERFFETLYKRTEDIMPSIDNPYQWPYSSTWANTHTRAVFGRSQECFINGVNGLTYTRYFLSDTVIFN